MSPTLAVVLAIAACGLLYVLSRPARPKKATAAQLRDELRRMTHDPDVVDRLLERMQRKHPRASEREVLRLAIAELRADRRR